MEFFLDHDVPSRVGLVLRQAGHKVVFLRVECAAVLRLIERAGDSGLQGNINFA